MAKAPKNTPKDRRLENLRPPWQPGESGNPAGLPAGTVQLRTMLKAKLGEVSPGQDRRTLADKLVDATIDAAIKGDPQARKLVWEYVEGAPKQSMEVTGSDGGPIELTAFQNMSTAELIAEAKILIAEASEAVASYEALPVGLKGPVAE